VNILARAIITGFGLRLGAELAKYVTKRLMPDESNPAGGKSPATEEDDDETPTAPEL
jgi:hypothetical protein